MRNISALFLTLLISCGMSPRDEIIREPANPPRLPGGGGSSVDPTTQALGFLQENCSSCHASASDIKTKASFCRNALNRVKGGSMPLKSDSNYYLWEDGVRKAALISMCNS